jgi:hypothetical protein
MPLYKDAPAPPRGPEPVFGPPPPAKIAVDEGNAKLPQPLRMLTNLLEVPSPPDFYNRNSLTCFISMR